MMWFNKNKQNFSRFPSFRFDPITKVENSEISEMFLILQSFIAFEIQDPKTKENDLSQKTITL